MRNTPSRARRPRAHRSAAAARLFDAQRSFPRDYKATADPAIVTVSPASYLAIEGTGEPGGAAFREAVGALYAVAYGLATSRKKEGRASFRIGKLEGLWHATSEHEFLAQPREAWSWTLLLRIPDFVSASEVAAAASRPRARAAASRVRRLSMDEGPCVQVLHVGPYADEPGTMARVNAFLDEADLVRHGSHHEIYLSDPQRTPPERTRTILRHPVRHVGELAHA